MTKVLSFLHAMLVVYSSFNERLLARWVEGESGELTVCSGMIGNFELIASSYL